MRIGIDASWASVVGTGTGSYTAGLVTALAGHRELDFYLYFRPGDEEHNPVSRLTGPHIHTRVISGHGQIGRTLVSMSRAAAQDHLDVYHSPGYFLPLWRGPKVVTFHDVNMFLQWDKWWRPGMRLSWMSLCAQTLLASRTARTVVADSHHAAEAIRSVLRVPSNRLSVLYPGVDDRYFQSCPGDTSGLAHSRFNLGEYVLSVGVLSPQKNLEGLIRAFARARYGDLRLAIAGREDGAYFRDVLVPLVTELRLQRYVHFLGVVDAADLPALYTGARAFLFPSFAEGFGLPPLEAMACGTPVVASNRSSIPEILDDAALLIDPADPDELAEALCTVLQDSHLHSDLSRRGRARAARFRWDTSAQEALRIYADVA